MRPSTVDRDIRTNADQDAQGFVSKAGYIDRAYASLERDRLWPKVWQVACREEEIPDVGSYVEYTIHDESIIVVRSGADEISAYFNTCQHRGRQLVSGIGRTQRFRCPFHGWRYDLDGALTEVTDRGDFGTCDLELSLRKCQVGTWGGFVFVHMDADNEIPIEAHLDPARKFLDPFELGSMRFSWYKTIRLPANWKTALDSFNEGYHFSATHPQLLPVMDERTVSVVMGDHAMFRYSDDNVGTGVPSPRLGVEEPEDPRELLAEFMRLMEDEVGAIWSPRSFEVTRARFKDSIPDGMDAMLAMGALIELHKAAAIADGAGWPDISFEQLFAAGADWHIFPNLIILPYPDGMLAYRTRPDGLNPDSCIFDVWSLARYSPGAEPPVERIWIEDWRDHEGWGRIFRQDFANIEAAQRGLHSRGFGGLRTNPVKESAIPNYHRVLRRYLDRDDGQ